MKYLFPIVATHCNGESRLLYSGQEVLDLVASAGTSCWYSVVGEEWTRSANSYYGYGRFEPTHNEWILRDDRGRPVDWKVFKPVEVHWKKRKGTHTFRWGPAGRGRNYGPRGGGVNHQSKKNSGLGARLRAGEDVGCTWDYYDYGHVPERSWKAHRSTQWR